MRFHLLTPVLLVPALLSCGRPANDRLASSDEEVCELITAAVVAQGEYRKPQVAGCDALSEKPGGYLITRLNGHCREPVCGSVLLGWYAVQQETGRIFEWNMGEDAVGREIAHST
jgi:hypothetical protein